MSTRARKTAAVLTGSVVLASGAYALGSQAGNGSAVAKDQAAAARPTIRPARWRHDARAAQGLADLAQRLGVSEAKLRTALEDLRPQGDPRADLAAGLAKELGVDRAKVTAALDALPRRGPGRFGHGPGGPRGDHAGLVGALATALGKSEADVRAALRSARPDRAQGPDAFVATLAKALGVDAAKVRTALERLRPGRDHDGPGGPDGGARVQALAKALGVDAARLRAALRKLHEQRETAFVNALAQKLGLDPAKVRTELEAGGHHDGRHGP